jgi:hypothetical protein
LNSLVDAIDMDAGESTASRFPRDRVPVECVGIRPRESANDHQGNRDSDEQCFGHPDGCSANAPTIARLDHGLSIAISLFGLHARFTLDTAP